MLLDFRSEEGDAIPVKPFPANTGHCLVFYLEGQVTAVDPQSGTALVYPKIALNGSQLSRFDFHISPRFRILSVEFQPGVLSRFLRESLREFTDVRVDAEALLQPGIRTVQEQLCHAKAFPEIVTIIEAYLWKRISSGKLESGPIDRVARVITENPAGWTIRQLAAEACLSVSQFERRFTDAEGITPKLYARINRFFKACQWKERHPGRDWLGIALDAGYYDYQHLVKDFRQFASTTPQSLLQAQAASPDGLASGRAESR
jgi:AraC-like DNA-binding protein